jgi:DNA-directed RNA polymerase specialized sigma24 family protein
MAINRLIHLLHTEHAAPGDGVSDAELLRRCAGGKDEVAFELLMRGHADLVWRVCRVVTGDHHAAEGAFQAAFLALARKPPRAVNGPVAGWLYRVAYHAALKARPRRATTYDLDSDLPAPPDATDIGQKEIAGLLYEELNRLAEAYRVPPSGPSTFD